MSPKKSKKKKPVSKETPGKNEKTEPVEVKPVDQDIQCDSEKGSISFVLAGKEVLKIEAGGKFYVNGHKVKEDKEIYTALKNFLQAVPEQSKK